jgi:soluble lytic murein transglycosylase-like protein
MASNKIKWRPCPSGQHWRKEHYQPTYRKTDGTVVKGHRVSAGCCKNPSKKDQIYSDELKVIAEKFFSKLKGAPSPDDLGFGKDGTKYDELIRGWTQFWNDILNAKDPLDADLVKALIATESGFKQNPKVGSAKARGLMQVTDETRKILADDNGELKDHLVHINQKDITDPTLNIAAGTRWLFQKKILAGVRLKRTATWDEAIAEYKSYLNKMIKDPNYVPRPMKNLRSYYNRLKK